MVHIPFEFYVVLWVLLRDETSELQDGGVVTAAEVSSRGGLILGNEHLGVTEVVDVAYGHAVRGRLHAYHDIHLCLVA